MSQKGTFTAVSPNQTTSKLAAQHLAHIWCSANASAAAAELQSITHEPTASQTARQNKSTLLGSARPSAARGNEIQSGGGGGGLKDGLSL